MDQFKTKGEAAPHSDSFVELRIDDLVRESVTWSPQSKAGAKFSEPLPNVIHGLLTSLRLN